MTSPRRRRRDDVTAPLASTEERPAALAEREGSGRGAITAGTNPVLCSDATCGGICPANNPCECNDNTPCMPAGADCPVEDNTCCTNLPGWYWDSTLQCCTDVPQCNPSCLSDEQCDLVGTDAVCGCNKTTYSEITISDLEPTVTCDNGIMIASVRQCQLEALGYNYSSFHLSNDSVECTYTYPDIINNSRIESIQVKAAIGWCGNIDQNDGSKVYFTNTLHIYPNGGKLITKNPIVFNFSCKYDLTMQTSLNFSLSPVLSTVSLPAPDTGIGSFTVTMAAYSQPTFNVPIQTDEVISVGSNIYLGLFSPYLDGNVFALRAEKCFATPSTDPNNPNNVTFVSGGCAVSDEIQSTVLENGNSTEVRIQISAFLFQGYSEIYIFCDVTLCNKTNGCQKCDFVKAAKADLPQVGIKLNLEDSYLMFNSGHHTVASWAMLAASLLGLLSWKLF